MKYKPVTYAYSLAKTLRATTMHRTFPFEYLSFGLRAITILIIASLIAKPQFIDYESKLPIDGIDIMLVLDVSGSMDTADFSDDSRTRFVIAKQEAIRFIEKRLHDSIGLVFFGKYALSRCPLTFDKKLLRQIIGDLQLGFIDPDGTVLSRAVIAAVNRLKSSAAKTKIMIVLTDGEPSEEDLDISIALESAKQFAVKIYTVGIGSEHEQVLFHPLYGPIIRAGVNKDILELLATETGGCVFMAHNATDMRLIYDTIDQLERSAQEVPIYSEQKDTYQLPLIVAMLLVLLEFFLSSTFWFSL